MAKKPPPIHLRALPVFEPRMLDKSIVVSDIPSSDVLLDLGVEPHETDEFIKAFAFVQAQVLDGQNVKQAAAAAGIDRTNVYDAKWQRLISLARRLILGQAIMEVQAVVAKVYDKWPAIVDKLIDTALNAQRTSDSNEAADLLYNYYIRDAQGPADASESYKYLREQQNFNPQLPLTAIQAMAGATVNITVTQKPTDEKPVGDVIDIDAQNTDFSPAPLE